MNAHWKAERWIGGQGRDDPRSGVEPSGELELGNPSIYNASRSGQVQRLVIVEFTLVMEKKITAPAQ